MLIASYSYHRKFQIRRKVLAKSKCPPLFGGYESNLSSSANLLLNDELVPLFSLLALSQIEALRSKFDLKRPQYQYKFMFYYSLFNIVLMILVKGGL